MPTVEFPYNRSTGKLEEFLNKLKDVGIPDKIGTAYPATLGFGSSHARSFPIVLKFVNLLDSSGTPTDDVYKKGLRGGQAGRAVIGKAIATAYKPMFDVYADAPVHAEGDLITFVKTNSKLDAEQAGLVIRTFKVLCKFGNFDGVADSGYDDSDDDEAGGGSGSGSEKGRKARSRRGSGGQGNTGVNITVNIALSVDATSDPAVYDAFFAAMAKHLGELTDGA